MKKITNFIVEKRNIFLVLFIILAGLSLYLSTFVNINEDIMEYLPKSSETKIGNDIMEKEFSKQDTSVLNVMFKNLTPEEKEQTLKKLQKIKGVSSVLYENTNEYNTDKYTLYILNVSDYADSDVATNVYQSVEKDFDVAGMSGGVYDANKPILHISIIIIAIACAMVILVILSESYVEPFLYLITIGLAVFINKGTNVFFDSVSSITDSITAILQLALSMDYSIMLSNRFKQEKEKTNDKIKAMKEALYQSFKSISSSSVTTIVGLLALVFMSFTIGRDLGLVLSKGVLLSLICIFVCLPALLLLCDNLISKTHKKSPHFNLTKLGKFSYKTRWFQTVAIIILFVVVYFLQGNTTILYTDSEQDQVGKVFPATNQIAIVYENKYENLMAKYCQKLENDQNIEQVLCYANTINEKLSYSELNQKLESLNQDVNIDDYLIKLIYSYKKDKSNQMTLEEFINFLEKEIYSNNNFNSAITSQVKENINLLANFSKETQINQLRSTNELASILGMSQNDADNILVYYNSKNPDTLITLKQFVDFMINDVAKNPDYASSLDKNTLNELKTLQYFTDANKINKKMNAQELANIFGLSSESIEKLLLFARINEDSSTKMTLNTFANFALEMALDPSYQAMFSTDTINSLNLLKVLSNASFINNKLSITDMASTLANLGLNLDDKTISLLYMLYNGSNTDTLMTLNTFATTAIKLAALDDFKSYFSQDTINSLKTIVTLTQIKDTIMSNQNLYQLFGITDSTKITQLEYVLASFNGTLTPSTFINILLNNEQIKNSLSESELAGLLKAKYIIDNSNTLYSMLDLAKELEINPLVASVIYGTYDNNLGKISSISIKELINFISDNKDNPLINSYINNNKDLLNLAYNIVNNTTTEYSYMVVSNITGTGLKEVKQIYGVYDYLNSKTLLTPLELTNLILSNKDNELLKNNIDAQALSKVSLVNTVMLNTLNNTNYNAKNLSKLLGIDNNTMNLLFSLYNSTYIKNNQNVSLYNYVNFIITDVMNNLSFAKKFDGQTKDKLQTINTVMKNSLNQEKYSSHQLYSTLRVLSDDLEENLIELVYIYYGSVNNYDDSMKLTVEEFVEYLNSNILTDKKFDDFIDKDMRKTITKAKEDIIKAKDLIVSKKYSRIVLNTKYPFEGTKTSKFINTLEKDVGNNDGVYIVGNSSMAVEMSKTFNRELNKITILTMIFIFIVVAITFKSLLIPLILVLIIQCAVYITMSFISVTGGSVYFIALLIVQAILMGATIDYAIVYTSYYKESRLTMDVKNSIINAYNKSIHTIISSSSILIIVTLIVANFASAIAAKICETISQGAFASVILILVILPGVLAASDKIICRHK